MASSNIIKIFIEPNRADPRPIQGPIIIDAKESLRATYQRLFDEHQDAEALWVLLPGQREPFRFPWRNLFQRFTRGKKSGPKGKSRRDEVQS